MEDCIFCKITRGELPSKIALETGEIVAFHDIQPQAPVHILIIPKRHVEAAVDLNQNELKEIFAAVKTLSQDLNLENGYRIVVNSGSDAGQAVPHVHFHLLAKRKLGWPPG